MHPSLTRTAASATLHCLTGCAIGEVLGMVIATALGWSDVASIALAVTLAFMFGYGLSMLPLLRHGLGVKQALKLALIADTASIATMEITDNAIMLTLPGAMSSHLDSLLFWGSLAVSLGIAYLVAFPLNRWLIAHGKGHAMVADYHHGHHH